MYIKGGIMQNIYFWLLNIAKKIKNFFFGGGRLICKENLFEVHTPYNYILPKHLFNAVGGG